MKRNRNERASGEMGPAGVCIQTCYFSGDGGGGDAGDGGYRGPFWAQGSCLEGREERAESEQRAERASPGGTAGAAPGAGSRGRRRPRVGRRSRGIPEGGRDGETDGRTDGQGRPWARCPSRVSHSQPRTVCQAQPEERPRSAQTLNPRSLASPQHPASLPSSQEEKPALKSSKA